MIILRQTFFNTTTQATTSNGTATVSSIFDRNRNTTWQSDNAGTDSTAATFRVVFEATQTVSQIVLLGINLKNFSVHPNTTTSNFTPSISETTNSATSLYYAVGTNTTVKELVVTMNTTQTVSQEKEIGELIVSNLLYDFNSDRLPSAKGYKPTVFKKQIAHQMSDGGIILYNITNKFRANVNMDFVPTSTVNTLKTIYDLNTPYIFIPFETSTSWNGDIAEAVWPGEFDFVQFTDNDRGNGYTGSIEIRQTPGGLF